MNNWIVVVDDEAFSLTSVRSLLSTEDIKISCLTSGRDLLRFIEKNNPDLILLDVMMPEMDGFETLTKLRNQEKTQNRPEIPVIFLTGEQDSEAEKRGLKLGAADYIHKPFNKDVLISRIHNTIINSKRIESLTNDATKDKLTGLLNKGEGVARISDILVTVSGALLILDLDSFKLVNDLYGHEKGDQILKKFAELTKDSTREDDVLCRIGGDEFLLFCCGLNDEKSLAAFTSRLNRKLEEEALLLLGPDHGIPLGVSVGAVMVPEYGTNYEDLFKLADEAMYKTKQKGKHGYTVYTNSEYLYETFHNSDKELHRVIKIMEERNEGREAIMLGTGDFSIVFRFLERLNNTYNFKSMLFLFILIPKKVMNDKTQTNAMTSFAKVLQKILKKSDVIMQNRNNQFLVMLPMMHDTDPESIYNKIVAAWNEVPESIDFEIKMSSQLR